MKPVALGYAMYGEPDKTSIHLTAPNGVQFYAKIHKSVMSRDGELSNGLNSLVRGHVRHFTTISHSHHAVYSISSTQHMGYNNIVTLYSRERFLDPNAHQKLNTKTHVRRP
jgi:hypothetical protein